METETAKTNEAQDHQLRVDVAVLAKTMATKEDIARIDAVLAGLKETMATKEDIARIDATTAALKENCATKADLAQLETRITKWMITTLVGVAAMNTTLVLIVVKLMQV